MSYCEVQQPQPYLNLKWAQAILIKYFRIISVTQGCCWSGVWFASILVLLIQYWYDLLAILKCNAALNHVCTVPISPLSPGCCRICLQCVTELTVNASQHFGTDPGLSWEEAVLKWTCQSLAELEKRIQARFETRFVHTCTSWPCFSRGLQFWA